MDFNDRLEELIKANNMTAKALAEKLGVGPTMVTQWKRGKSTPSPTSLIDIASIFHVSLDWLLTGKGGYTMNNEEKILAILTTMQEDISGLKQDVQSLKEGQTKLEAGQAKLETGQAETNTRLEKVEAGQVQANQRLEIIETKIDEQKEANAFLSNLAMDIHDSAEKHHAETQKEIQAIQMSVTTLEQISSKNMFDISRLKAANS